MTSDPEKNTDQNVPDRLLEEFITPKIGFLIANREK